MKPTYEDHKKHCAEDRPGAWPRLEYEARQTGRTTRMMEAAKKASYAGCTVDIIVFDHNYARELQQRWRTQTWPTAVHLYTARTAPFGVHQREEIEKAHPYRKVFVSHEAIEFDPVIKNTLVELHRFDLEPKQ